MSSSRASGVIVPGGVGALDVLEDKVMLDWLRSAHTTSRFTTSVCSGSLTLAAAGLLPGLTATTYRAFMDKLTELGAVPASARVVKHLGQRIITSAEVSSGIDMALELAELITDRVTAETMQLIMEYDPQPPFDAGSVEKAGPLVVARAKEIFKTRAERGGVRAAPKVPPVRRHTGGSPPAAPGLGSKPHLQQ